MVKHLFSLIIVFLCSNVKAQDTTLTFTREEFAKFKFIKQALKGLPGDCTIQSYEISMYMINGVKTQNYIAGQKDEYTRLFMEHAAKNGGELKVTKLKTACTPGKHKENYKIIVK